MGVGLGCCFVVLGSVLLGLWVLGFVFMLAGFAGLGVFSADWMVWYALGTL